LNKLKIQDPAIPTRGQCFVDKCAMELLIKIAEGLGYRSLCALSRVSKRFAEVAQDVLYRFVDIRACRTRLFRLHGGTYSDESDQFKPGSEIAGLSWTISTKPHLAAKVKELWWWPQSTFVHHRHTDPASSPFAGDWHVYIDERRVASELLIKLTAVEKLSFVVREQSMYWEQSQWDHGKAMFANMGLRQDMFTSVVGLANLKSLYLDTVFLIGRSLLCLVSAPWS
jgi:hypothetical protein